MPPKAQKKVDDKEEKIQALTTSDIQILKTYGQGAYAAKLKKTEHDIKEVQKRIDEKLGVKESDTGLAPPNLWDLPVDRQRMGAHPLQVARCTKIIPVDPKKAEAARAVNPVGAAQGQKGADEQDKYVINIKQIAKFVVGLGDRVAPTDIEEGMRVGVDRNKYQIQIPLPPKIDASVTMMQVEEKPDVTYSDVGGCKEQIEKLREVVETPLLSPERFVKLGIDPPKGVLLFGPPGTGKTLCARAVANRTDATFIRVIGSELVQKYVGEGARMVRELFEMARSKKACIIFFDEVDAIGGARFDDGAGGDNEVQRTMLELINQLDGFDPRGNIKVLMATNRPDTLDPALLRPGRLDRRVEFSLPDNEGRAHILKIHARSMSVERDIRFDLIARLCPNTTGAELRSVATEAGMFAIRARRKVATERDFLDAVEKVVRQGTKFSSTVARTIQRRRYHVRRAPSPLSSESARLLDSFAAHPPLPLTLSALVSFGNPLTPASVLRSVTYVLSEIPRRMARRVRALEGLPFIVGTNPYVSRTLNGHRDSFNVLATFPEVRTLEDNKHFVDELDILVQRHRNDIPTMAKGFQECSRYMSSTQISNFLDGAIRSRISVRLIAEQHIALSHALATDPGAAEAGVLVHNGVIDPKCSPAEMVRMCGAFVSELCEATLGASPNITIDGCPEATFAYVPVHLEYILTEMLKNAFRATVEHHHKLHGLTSSHPLPPGGGVSASNMARIFSYAFTTAGHADDQKGDGGPYAAQHIGGSAAIGSGSVGEGGNLFGEITEKGIQVGLGTIAGLGYGLPLSRLYAKYFGGSLDVFSLDGWGSDVFIKLRCLLDDAGNAEI
ncbi:P-loop containing nucleoside triphosphate hydrolase protein [Suillus subalutaceus]|uniref:P-loop containing nucleoside triphosphate hydrolase protein n=1 Tax=Suillus subalutaceus TaxID=48586 RepID=UPI001B86E901|nr:P-loop containing nucleoside triphosphate hydrolase protein [Suillus subalutaceus]KAG1837694.1 P-loop containing nucleoside triphosphate hydrolase protein [Suillus subalutaceus]